MTVRELKLEIQGTPESYAPLYVPTYAAPLPPGADQGPAAPTTAALEWLQQQQQPPQPPQPPPQHQQPPQQQSLDLSMNGSSEPPGLEPLVTASGGPSVV